MVLSLFNGAGQRLRPAEGPHRQRRDRGTGDRLQGLCGYLCSRCYTQGTTGTVT